MMSDSVELSQNSVAQLDSLRDEAPSVPRLAQDEDEMGQNAAAPGQKELAGRVPPDLDQRAVRLSLHVAVVSMIILGKG
jgi:hypothetical protein